MSIISFFRCVPGIAKPQRADRSAGGVLPTRAFRYCEPVCTASAFGWYVFAPLNFSLMWDGAETICRLGESDDWYSLGAIQFPNFSNLFDSKCPSEIKGYSPPFIGVGPEPGLVQIWTGYIVRSSPDWFILIRQPANIPRSLNYDYFEGIIETDHWFGPLFTNLRLTKTDVPINFRFERPLVQIQPIHRATLDEDVLGGFEFKDSLEAFSAEDWDSYHRTIVLPGSGQRRERAHYAKKVRKRTKEAP